MRTGCAILSLSDVLLRAAGPSFLHYSPAASVIKLKKKKDFSPLCHIYRSPFCIQSAETVWAVVMRPVGHSWPSWGEWQSLAEPAGTFWGHDELRCLPDSEVKLQRASSDFAHAAFH